MKSIRIIKAIGCVVIVYGTEIIFGIASDYDFQAYSWLRDLKRAFISSEYSAVSS
jgi:hypothetical protein